MPVSASQCTCGDPDDCTCIIPSPATASESFPAQHTPYLATNASPFNYSIYQWPATPTPNVPYQGYTTQVTHGHPTHYPPQQHIEFRFNNRFASQATSAASPPTPLSDRSNIPASPTPPAPSTRGSSSTNHKRKAIPGPSTNSSLPTRNTRARVHPSPAEGDLQESLLNTASASTQSNHSPLPSIPGCGPTSSNFAPTLHPQFHHQKGPSALFEALKSADNPSSARTDASDVWFFVFGLTSPTRSDFDASQPLPKPNVKAPDPKKFTHVGCRFCVSSQKWAAWKLAHGQTNTIRKHLKKEHETLWVELVRQNKLKNWESTSPLSGSADLDGSSCAREPFTLEGFYERLLAWIAVDDQSLNVVDCPEFRELLLFLGADYIRDADLPHRTKLSELIVERFKLEYMKMVSEIKNSVGRVSFTTDVWSRTNLESYLAVTAHWFSSGAHGETRIVSRLIAFRLLNGSHTGENIGKTFIGILKEVGALEKIAMVTLDNASSNGTALETMADCLRELNIAFSMEGNRIRCFPHVVNLAVKAGLQALSSPPPYDVSQSFETADYYSILESDVISAARKLVTACRASGQRREALEEVIKEGNTDGGWLIDGEKKKIEVYKLKRDVDTRWSSVFFMLERLLLLMPAIKEFVKRPRFTELSDNVLTDAQVSVLKDIQEFLLIFHVVQELVSAEKTPTLPVVLPMYEKLIEMLGHLKIRQPNLAHAIEASICKLQDYLSLSRRTKVYALAMCLNPTVKLRWMQDHWLTIEYLDARKNIRETLMAYERQRRQLLGDATTGTPQRKVVRTASASLAASAQTNGLKRLNILARCLSDSCVQPSTSAVRQNDGEASILSSNDQVEADIARVVDAEMARYEADGLLEDEDNDDEMDVDPEPFDICVFWRDHKKTYPLFYRAALDVLPAQASAVPCERVFSSSKETDTLRRANLSPFTMEILQILKFIVRQERLNFMEGEICTEAELTIVDLPLETLNDLFARGELEQLEDIILDSYM